MSALKDNIDRAERLTVLAAKIMKTAVAKNASDSSVIQSVVGAYAAADAAFVSQTFTLIDMVIGLAKNPFGFLYLLGLKDPYMDQRETLKAFCRNYLVASQLSLSSDDLALIGLFTASKAASVAG